MRTFNSMTLPVVHCETQHEDVKRDNVFDELRARLKANQANGTYDRMAADMRADVTGWYARAREELNASFEDAAIIDGEFEVL